MLFLYILNLRNLQTNTEVYVRKGCLRMLKKTFWFLSGLVALILLIFTGKKLKESNIHSYLLPILKLYKSKKDIILIEEKHKKYYISYSKKSLFHLEKELAEENYYNFRSIGNVFVFTNESNHEKQLVKKQILNTFVIWEVK